MLILITLAASNNIIALLAYILISAMVEGFYLRITVMNIYPSLWSALTTEPGGGTRI